MYFYLLIYLCHFGSIWGIFRPCALTNSSWRCNWFNLKILQSFWVFGFGALRDGTSHLQSSLSHTRVSVLGYTQASSDIREIFTVDSISYVTYTWRVICVFCHGDSTRTVFFCFHDNKLASFIQTLFLRDEVIPQMTAGNLPLTSSGPLPLHLHMCPSSTQTLTLCEGEKYSRSFLWCHFSRTQWVKHRCHRY